MERQWEQTFEFWHRFASFAIDHGVEKIARSSTLRSRSGPTMPLSIENEDPVQPAAEGVADAAEFIRRLLPEPHSPRE